MEFSSVYGCCTGQQLSGWGIYVNENTPKTKQIQQKISTLNDLKKKSAGRSFFKDFAMIFAITTNSQLNYKGSYAKELLEGLGFKESFVGGKSEKDQRHKETGALTMWCISPNDFEEGIRSMEAKYKADLDALQTPESKREERAVFPDFTLTELIKIGIANRQKAEGAENTVRDTFAERIIIDRTAFENHFEHKFGFNLRDNLGLTYWNRSILDVKQFHQAWKRGEK